MDAHRFTHTRRPMAGSRCRHILWQFPCSRGRVGSFIHARCIRMMAAHRFTYPGRPWRAGRQCKQRHTYKASCTQVASECWPHALAYSCSPMTAGRSCMHNCIHARACMSSDVRTYAAVHGSSNALHSAQTADLHVHSERYYGQAFCSRGGQAMLMKGEPLQLQ